MNKRITPWFGSWPPELKGEPEMENDNNGINVWRRLLRLSWLLLITALCFLLIVFFSIWSSGFQILLATIGSTSLVVFLLGVTVDWWLKQAILKDVFKAAIGYLLPPELRPEMEWVYKQEVIAVKHNQKYRIELLEDNLVILEVTINRTLKNISHHRVSIEPLLSTDEWFHSGKPSEILSFGWVGKEGEEINPTRTSHGLRVKGDDTNKISLAPQEEKHLWNKFTETKHINDFHTMTFIYATQNPFVDVEVSNGLDISVEFAAHEQHTINKVGNNAYMLHGTLLPGQQISIRWWSIEDSEKWLSQEPQSR